MAAFAGPSNRDMLNASLAGLASALLFLASASSVLLWLLLYTASTMPLYGMGLYAGWLLTLVAGGVGTLIVSVFQPPEASLGVYFVSVALAPALIAFLLFGDRKPSGPISSGMLGRALATLCVIGAAAGAFTVLSLELSNGKPGVTSDAIRMLWEQAVRAIEMPQGEAGVSVEDSRRDMIEQFRQLGDGIIEMAIVELWVVIHVIASALVLRMSRKSRLSVGHTELSMVRTPRWILVAVAFAGLAVLLAGDQRVGPMVALAALAMPFLLEGIAVAHVVSRRWPVRPLALTLIYLATLFVPLARFILTLVGMADHWLEWRKKASASSDKGA